MRWWIVFLSAPLLLCVSAEHRDQESLCASQQTCSACLQTPQCVWCSAMVSGQNSGSLVRCVTREKHQKEGDLWCHQEDVVDESNSMILIENRALTSGEGGDAVQSNSTLFESMKLKINSTATGEEFRVKLSYRQAEDYPVDLYYLMDLSASMESYRDNLSHLGLELAQAMQNLTSNFRLGFGSFVDKVALPMTNTQPDKLLSPCYLTISGKKCAPPYGYKNQMPLTENVAEFESQVKEAPVSGNLDAPEGGFDAMMQAMVCTKEIGWRQKARHLLVFSTDAQYHIAGDGKLAGIIEPNDCLCHLDEKGFYNYSLLQDYPSISQIRKKVREQNMHVIFAVTKNKYTVYETLSKEIALASIGTIDTNSGDIVALLRDEYEKLVTSVIMTDDAPKIIDVQYFSRCLNKTGELINRKECGGLRVGNVIDFEIVLKAVDCPSNPDEWLQRMEIKPEGINESLVIEVDIICNCSCENPEYPSYQKNSVECKENGILTCGICSCNEGFYGKQCECERNEAGTESAAAMAECKPDNQTMEICSGHGVCKCGVCDCAKRSNPQEVFYGKYCECDNFSCKRSGGQVCGGRGKCECGVCNCLPGWGGETCDCKETNSTCMPTGEITEICSGRGDCICGSCHCREKDNMRYSGQYCEECPTCPGQRCGELKDCVECYVHKTGPLAKNDRCGMCMHEIDIVDVVETDPEKNQETGTRFCRTPGDAGCTFVFTYKYHREGTGGDIKIFKITAQKERQCPTAIDVLGVALGVVISTVVIGFLILLAWKILTMIHDQREYAKFEQQRALAKWDRGDNPLYKQATSTFNNPTFAENTKH